MMKILTAFMAISALLLGATVLPAISQAKTVKVKLDVQELDLPIDNKGTTYRAWAYEGKIPGPLVRVTEGDTVEFEMTNEPGNKNSHSIDFHAARADVLNEFAPIAPGKTKKFTFTADYPGIFFYHCGSDPMIQHIARGMFGAIIVDPKDEKLLPKADREYLLVQSEVYENPEDVKAMMRNEWKHVVFNGRVFRYDPVHDPNATQMLEAKPGERVRIYFVNAGPNEFSSFHPIAGIWDRVYLSGNPHNAMIGMQSFTVGPGDAAMFDIISPGEGANAIVTHSLRSALTGAIAVLMYSNDAPDTAGRGDNIVVR